MEERNAKKENKILDSQGKSNEVGYCKPPKEYQWKPGQSGNPSGGVKKKKLADYITEEERREYVNTLKEKAKKDKKVMVFLIEQIFGKANQTLDSNVNVNKSWGEFLNELNGDNRATKKEP